MGPNFAGEKAKGGTEPGCVGVGETGRTEQLEWGTVEKVSLSLRAKLKHHLPPPAWGPCTIMGSPQPKAKQLVCVEGAPGP